MARTRSTSNAQSLNNKLGKILRMNTNPADIVPSDNPLLTQTTGTNQLIWAFGLRNPFTFAFQPGTGRIFINDVGGGSFEEINDGQAARNFGWPTTEGPFNPASFPGFINPLYAYVHNGGTPAGCAVAGGAFYNPSTPIFPASYVGKYFFADLCSGWIYYINPASPAIATHFALSISAPVDLKVGPEGALYYLARGAGMVGKIVGPLTTPRNLRIVR